MPYLNWSEKELKLEVLPERDPPQQITGLRLGLDERLLEALVLSLEEIFLQEEPELRLSLGRGWTLFWKSRQEGARALLAHPEPDVWVGTIGLEKVQGKRLVSDLKKLETGQWIYLSQFVDLGTLSNLDLSLGRCC